MMSEEHLRTGGYEIPAKHELKIHIVRREYNIYVTLIEGDAEIRGIPMVPFKKYEYSFAMKTRVYSHKGCKVLVEGYADEFFIAESNEMVYFLKSHEELELLRREAQRENKNGPMVIIIGNTNTGRTNFGKVLINHATQNGWTPISASITPGMRLGFLVIKESTDLEDLFKTQSSEIYHYGYKSPDGSKKLYIQCIREMMSHMKDTFNKNDHVKHSGLILHTCGYTINFGYRVLLEAIKMASINVAYVMIDENLMTSLKSDLKELPITFRLFPKCDLFALKPNSVAKRTSQYKKLFFGSEAAVKQEVLDAKKMLMYSPYVNKWNRVSFTIKTVGQWTRHRILSITTKALVKQLSLRILGHIYIEEVDQETGKVRVISTVPQLPEDVVFLLTEFFYEGETENECIKSLDIPQM